jgi:plastocyanin
MSKKLQIIVLILLAVALSGCTGSDSLETTSVEVIRFDRENQNLDAKIVDIKLEPDDIRAGEKVTAKLFIANTGSENITNETIEIKAKVKTLDDSLANLYIKTMSDEKKTRTIDPIEFETQIEPGTVKTVSANFNTIKEMEGRSLAGTFEITITLSVNGQKIEARILPVKLKSGASRNFTPAPTPASTPIQTPAPVPTNKIKEIAAPIPTPEPTPYVAATPTGKNITIVVKDDRYYPADITIDAGDMVLWVNKVDSDYTLVEMDKKIPDMVLRARNSYIFNTTGDYKIGLYFKPMRGEPRILAINVR